MSSDDQILENTIGTSGRNSLPPLNGIARKKRSDAGVLRKSSFDTFVDSFRRMTKSEQSTALEVLRQIQRLGLPSVPASAPTDQEETEIAHNG